MEREKFNLTMKSSEDEKLAMMAKEIGLSEFEMASIDKAMQDKINQYMKVIDEDEKSKIETGEAIAVETIALIVGIVVGACELIKIAYQAGKYAASQCEVRLGLTKAIYNGAKWEIRAALVAATLPLGLAGATVFVGFDDYFMGV